jgi:hypothetical protein
VEYLSTSAVLHSLGFLPDIFAFRHSYSDLIGLIIQIYLCPVERGLARRQAEAGMNSLSFNSPEAVIDEVDVASG